LQRLLQELTRQTASTNRPLITTFFGNPYVAIFMPDLAAVLLTYDFYDRAEASAVRAIAGEAPIGGRLPIALPGLAERGFGLVRTGSGTTGGQISVFPSDPRMEK
jgi:beta-N-acetylhexosaminidase